MSQPNRKTARDAFCTFLAPLAGDGAEPFKAILNADSSGVDGRSPLLLVYSSGSRRQPLELYSSNLDNDFRIEVNILVAEDDPTGWNDVMDDCEQAIAEYIGDKDNRVTADWFWINWENDFSLVAPAVFGAEKYKYMAESFNVLVNVKGQA